MISIGIARSDELGNGPGCPARAVRRDHAPEGMFGTVPHNIAAPTAVYAHFESESFEKVNVRPRRDHTTVTVAGVSFSVGRDRTTVTAPHCVGRWVGARSGHRPLPVIDDAEAGYKTFAGTVRNADKHETSEEGIEMMMKGTSTARIPKGMDAGRSHDRV